MALKKSTDEQIIKIYEKTKSCWKTAEILGMCGQSVHERLVRMGKSNGKNEFSEKEKQRLIDVYNSGIFRGDGKLKKLSEELNRTIPFLSRKAKELGLTNYHRKLSENLCKIHSERAKKYIEENGHPQGMKGKHHKEEVKKILKDKSTKMWTDLSIKEKNERVTKMLKCKLMKRGNLSSTNRESCSWKAGWREIGGKRKYFRSKWEANYARYLEFLKQHNEIKEWRHEPKTFWFEKIKRGCRSYLPDFEVTLNNDKIEWHEVKGWYDARSKTVLKRMQKYYPNEKIVVIFERQYREISKQMKNLINDWE